MSGARPQPDLDRLLRPRSVAVIGATDDPTKVGYRIISNLDHTGYGGRIHPVNPRVEAVAGRPCSSSPLELPEAADVAYVLVPADRVVEAVTQCAQRGVGFAIVAAAGFAETPGAEGRERQDALEAVCREHPIRVVGPNCNGIYNVTDAVSIGFNTAHGRRLPAGPLAILSHSGALFASLAQRCIEMSVGISKFVSVGNEADLGLLDFMEHLIDDPATRVFGLVLDGVPDGDRFARLCRAARQRDKRVLALRFGESPAGAQAATAHSSRLAGAAGATNALLDHLGVGRVSSVEALVAAAAMVSVDHPAGRSGGVGAWTMSGAAGSILADAATRFGVPMATFTATTQAELDGFARLARIVNPVDVGALGDVSAHGKVMEIVAADEDVSELVATPHDMGGREQNLGTLEALVGARTSSGKRLTVLVPGGLAGVEDDLRAAGAVIIRDTATALEALAAARAAERPTPPTRVPPGASGEVTWPSVPTGGDGVLTEPESMALLGTWGVPTARWLTVGDAEEAVAALPGFGGALVVKGVVRGVAHKSERGLVRLGVDSPASAREAFAAVHAAVESSGGGEVIVQEVVRGRAELIAGLTRDPLLGPFVVVGLGGVFAEELDQTVVVAVTATRAEVTEVLLASPVGRMLTSPRWGQPPLQAVLEVVEALQALAGAAGDALDSVDVNPLVVSDGSAVAADALVIRSSSAGDERGGDGTTRVK